MSDRAFRRVAVLAGTSLGWREKIMRGIAGYAHEHGPWHVYTSPEGTEDSLFFSETYPWDGLIVRITSGWFARRVLARRVPAVSIGSVKIRSPLLPRVKVNDDTLTAVAAKHLLGGGLRAFGYVSYFRSRNDEDRGPAFARHVGKAGCPCDFYSDGCKLRLGASWQSRQRDLARWLRRLTKPVGILTWNADIAGQVVEACHSAGIAVPRDVAILSGDEDEAKLELSAPPLSAIEIPAERIGYEAAALLDRLMQGTPPPEQPVTVEPEGAVIVRGSSRAAGQDDWELQQALRYIREHAAEAIGVDDIAASVQVSRRSLERRFREVLGHAPHHELRQTRLELAKKVLLETNWPLERVARASGFSSAAYLVHVFQELVRCTPAEFRRRLH
jgi:LacI family transcriptional regulator